MYDPPARDEVGIEGAGLPRRAVPGVVVAIVYLVMSLAWRVGVELTIGIAVVVWAVTQGADLGALDPEALLRVDVIALGTGVQLAGMAVLAAVFARWLRVPTAKAFALAAPPLGLLVAGALGGLTVGIFPGWIAEALRGLVPQLELGSLELIVRGLTEGPLLGRLLMLGAICIAAPLFEELVFRGFLWEELERSLPPWAVWLLTSVGFALYHIDPIQSLAVIFTGLFLGWLRWWSGSVWPCIAAHFVNNTLAAVLTVTLGAEGDQTPLALAAAAAGITVALAGLGWLTRRAD